VRENTVPSISSVNTDLKVNPFIQLGAAQIFDWEKIVLVDVADTFHPLKKKKYDRLMQAVDRIASTYKGRDLLLTIYEHHGALRIREGLSKPTQNVVAIDANASQTCFYDIASHVLSIDFEELEHMVKIDEETGTKQRLSLEYILYYLMLFAAEKQPDTIEQTLTHYSQHMRVA
jgi:hypothetical protein